MRARRHRTLEVGAPLIDTVGVGFVDAGEGTGEDVPALREVSLRVNPGELVCVRGPSGAGKSTLLRILGCLDRPSEGAYRFAGNDVGELDDDGLAQLRLQGIGFVLVLLTGGAVGAGAGFLLGPMLSSLVEIPFTAELWFAGAALACAAVTGLLAGSIPAWRATRVQPAAWLVPR